MHPPGRRNIDPAAAAAHQAAIDLGQDGYLDPSSGLFVMTATFLATRPCCTNECRHCPWRDLENDDADG